MHFEPAQSSIRKLPGTERLPLESTLMWMRECLWSLCIFSWIDLYRTGRWNSRRSDLIYGLCLNSVMPLYLAWHFLGSSAERWLRWRYSSSDPRRSRQSKYWVQDGLRLPRESAQSLQRSIHPWECFPDTWSKYWKRADLASSRKARSCLYANIHFANCFGNPLPWAHYSLRLTVRSFLRSIWYSTCTK